MTTSATNPVTPVTPAPEVLDASGLVESLIATMPTLGSIRPLVVLTAGVLSWERLGYTRQETVDQMSAFKRVTLQTLQAGPNAMRKVADQWAAAIAHDFEELTGTALDPKTLDMRSRTDAELTEQEGFKKAAFDLRARVAADITSLGVRDLYAARHAKRANAITAWLAKAKTTVSGVVFEEVEPDSDALNAKPGWKTPPVLDPGNDHVKAVLRQLNMIETTVKRLKTAEAALKQLANMGVSRETIESIFDSASELADSQIVQSDTITVLAQHDQEAVAVRIAAYESVMAIINEAGDHLKA